MMRTAIVSGMGVHAGDWGNDWIDDAVQDLVQRERREGWYSHRDAAQDWRQKMPFDGDKLDSPPLGWVLLCQGEYSNLVDSIPHELCRCGIVMWDAARMNSRVEARIDYLIFGWDPRADDYHPSVIEG